MVRFYVVLAITSIEFILSAIVSAASPACLKQLKHEKQANTKNLEFDTQRVMVAVLERIEVALCGVAL